MRITKIILLISLVFGVTGCGIKQETVVPAEASAVSVSGSISQKEARLADQVVVSRSLRFGHVNSAPYGVFKEKTQIDVFVRAVQSAEKIVGIMDVVQPDYDVVIEQDGNRWEIHLWLDDQADHGMITYVSNTDTGYQLTADSARELYKLIWGLKYDSKKAIANGDFVNVHGKVSNLAVWEKFVANVKTGIRDEVQVVKYTIEGAPIFDNLFFDGQTIMHKSDTTHDPLGTPTTEYEFCKSIEEKKTERGTEYRLASCGQGNRDKGTFYLHVEK